MKSIFFFGILLLATASRLRVPVDEQLAQIDSTSYGKTLLDTLQIQLTSGSSVDAIVELLDELAADMHADQAVDDRLNATR
jgi:chromosome segregation ATPase